MTPRRFYQTLLIVSSLVLACAGCSRRPPSAEYNSPAPPEDNSQVTGGRCEYSDTKGRVRVTKIAPRDQQNEEVEVSFDFAPEGRDFQHDPDFRDFLDNGKFDPKVVKIGAEFPAEMHRRTTGTCVPLYFRIEW